MGYKVINPKYREKCSEGLRCTLYEARQPTVQNNDGANNLFESLKQINTSLGFCTVYKQEPPTIPTKLNGHKFPRGNVLSYQLALTEGNFNVITNFPALQRPELLMTPSLTSPLLEKHQLWDCKDLLLIRRTSLLVS